ncbi:MAG: hypothetical protein Q8P67_11755 [archaeon]|nr:hypothetical protein [archaeon]
MKQVMFILTVLAISTGCESAVSDAPSQVYWWPQPSSVVVCVIQSQSYSAVFSDPLQTPFMNSLLQQGASFSNAYAQNQGPIGSMMRLFAGTLAGMGTTPAFQSIPIEPFNLPNLAAKVLISFSFFLIFFSFFLIFLISF